MSRSGTFTYTEAQPAGDANKSWRCARCNGDYIIVGIHPGRLYSSSNRGVSWSEEQPAGAADKAWLSCDVSTNGKMIAGGNNAQRLYSKLAGSWVEERPAGDVNGYWYIAAISPDGSRMLAGSYGGRLWSYYDGSWTEERPAGDASKNWNSGDINNNGDMIAGIDSGRLYVKSAGGAWAETRPRGDTNNKWNASAISADGTKYLAAANSVQYYRYESGAWTRVNFQPSYPAAYYSTYTVDGDAGLDKIALGRSAYGGWANAAMNEIASRHDWPMLAGYTSSYCCAAMSSDGTLLVCANDKGRLYVYDKDALPDQAAGGYYKEFTYTHAAGTRYNYKVRVRVYNKAASTYLHCEGRANDDFSDIYFKNAAGNTLRHCIVKDEQYQNSLPAGYYYYVWVELDEIGTSPTTFRMYYGDSEHSDSSAAPADFFDQYDDFERGADGDAVGGVWSVTAGSVKISTDYVWRGTRAAEFVGAATPGAANIAATAGDETYIGFWAFKQDLGGLVAQHGDGSTYAKWAWGTDETLKNYTGGGYAASLESPNINYWNWFEMADFDWAADTYDLYRANAVKGEDLAMQASAGATNVLQLSTLGTSSRVYLYIDGLVICTNCSPYAVPDAESIGVEQLVGGTPPSSGPAGVKTWNDIPSANIKTWNDIPWNTIKAMN